MYPQQTSFLPYSNALPYGLPTLPAALSAPVINSNQSPFALPFFSAAQQSASNSPTQYTPGSIPDITQNHIYQALAGLQPSQIGGQPIDQQIQQAAQQSQNAGPGGLGGAIGGGITGGLIGLGVGGPIGALIGGLAGAGLGAFTPIMQTPQNAVVQAIKDIEDNNSGQILPDIGKQLIAQEAVPNYNDVFNKINPFPNSSPFGNTFILGGLTNPHTLANIGLNIATNPFTFTPVPEGGLAKLGESEIADAGIADAVKQATGGLDNVFLNKTGGALRNDIANTLGFDNYGLLTNAAKTNPELLQPFNEAFGSAIRTNPEAYLSNTALKIPIPFTNNGLPIASSKFANSLQDFAGVQDLNSNLRSLGQTFSELVGKSLPYRQVAQEFNPDVANNIENIIQSNENIYKTGNEQKILDDLLPLAKQYTPEQLQNFRNEIESAAGDTSKISPNNPLVMPLSDYKNYVQSLNSTELPFESEGYFPKELSQQIVGPQNKVEQIKQDLFGIQPQLDRNLAKRGYLPSGTAQSAMETGLKKFTDQATGQTIYGTPQEIGNGLRKIKETDRYAFLPKDLQEQNGVLGVYVDKKTKDIYFEKYLPVEEANQHLATELQSMGRKPLFEENPLVALASKDRNARRVAAYQNTFNQLLQLKDANGIPLIRPAVPAKNGTTFLKTGMDPATETLGKGVSKGYILPKTINNMLEDAFSRSPKDITELKSVLNPAGNLTRRLQIINPLYHLTHNVMFNAMLGGENPVQTFANIAKGVKPGYMEDLLKDPLTQEYIKAGGEVKGFSNALKQGKGVVDQLAGTFPNEGGIAGKAKDLLSKVDNYERNMVQSVELKTRLDLFEKNLAKGMSADQARQEAEKVVFAYGHQTKFEQAYLSNIFTFYNWMKNNTLLWAKHPNEQAVLSGVLNGINEATSGHQMALNPQDKQNQVYLGNFGGKDIYINPKLPFKDIQDFSTNPLQFFENRVNPLLSTAAHLATNTDYQGNQIVNPNLPLNLQQQNILGMNLDPRLAYALTNSITPLQGLNSMVQGKSPLTPSTLLQQVLGTPTSQVNPNDQQMQEYMAQKNLVDALAKYAQNHNAQGQKVATNAADALLTYQQANPYNISPGTQNYISSLQGKVNTLQDSLYGYHYNLQGQKVAATQGSKGQVRYAQRKARTLMHNQARYQRQKLNRSLRSLSHRSTHISLPKPPRIKKLA